jgi:uncharacterized protein (DUF305 family)
MAATRSSDQQVKDLGEKIKAAQEPEMEAMSSWLVAWGAPATAAPSTGAIGGRGGMGGMGGMDHSSTGGSPTSGVPGMMSEEQTTQLQNATGTDFDRTFLQQMVEHHAGAVQMAETEQRQGSNPQAKELAGSIVTSQSAQIEQMQQMLTSMG